MVSGLEGPVRGPWEYLDAAVQYSAPRQGLAVVRTLDQPAGADPPVRVYELLSISDERVWVRAVGAPQDGAVTINRLEIEWRPFRDPDKEKALLRDISTRIEDLVAGGGIAPAR